MSLSSPIPAPSKPEGLFRGTVTRTAIGGLPYVEVPRLVPDYEFGPLQMPSGISAMAGDRVVVGMIEGNPNDLIVLANLGS